MVDYWRGLTAPDHVLILYGGSREEFERVRGPKVYVDDPRLRTRDHQRERQSYTRALASAVAALRDLDWEWLYLAEYDELPFARDLWTSLRQRASSEQAALLCHRAWRIDDTLHPHYSAHLHDSRWTDWIETISTRSDKGLVLSCMGCGQFWRRDALESVVGAGEPHPAYLELHLPTVAHHLGYRVRGIGDQDRYFRIENYSIEELGILKECGAWVAHPRKGLWRSGTDLSELERIPKTPVVMAGVMPPPVHGQSLATKMVFEGPMERIDSRTVPMRSSQRLDQVGKASPAKLLGLIPIVLNALSQRFRSRAKVLYYTAGSGAWVPFIRDMILLGLLKPFFSRTVIHYHSGGLPEFLVRSRFAEFLGRWTYGWKCWAISLSRFTEVPGIRFGAEGETEIPNGIESPPPDLPVRRDDPSPVHLVFLGNLYEDKGVFDLLEAAIEVAKTIDLPLKLSFVGSWPDESGRERFNRLCGNLPRNLEVPEPRPRYDREKWETLADADILAFPTRYRSENLPLCIIEAMSLGLPVVATRWRGVPSLVRDGENGILVEAGDVSALAKGIRRLVEEPSLRRAFGEAGRRRYQTSHTRESFVGSVEKTLLLASVDCRH